jgi:hypothetical protein
MLYRFGRFPTAAKVAEKQKLFHKYVAQFSLRVSSSSDIHVQRNLNGVAVSSLPFFTNRAVGGERLGIDHLLGKRAGLDRWHIIHQNVSEKSAKERTDMILPLHPSFIQDIRKGRKRAEYRLPYLPKLQRVWYSPIGSNGRITIMVGVQCNGFANGRYEYKYRYYRDIIRTVIYPCTALRTGQPTPPLCFSRKVRDKQTNEVFEIKPYIKMLGQACGPKMVYKKAMSPVAKLTSELSMFDEETQRNTRINSSSPSPNSSDTESKPSTPTRVQFQDKDYFNRVLQTRVLHAK